MFKVTFWKHDKGSIRSRERTRGLNETIHHMSWNQEYKTKLNVSLDEIPTVFIGRHNAPEGTLRQN